MLRVSWSALLCAVALAAPAPTHDKEAGIGFTLQTGSQSEMKQYEASGDHLAMEYEVLRQFTPTSTADLIPVFQDQDSNYDRVYNLTHFPSPVLKAKNCGAAPNCEGLNRRRCFWTENVCGPCKHGFFGDAGDANTACVAMDCSLAPNCTSLNRFQCGFHEPNTCGPCLEDFQIPGSDWDPRIPDQEPGNDQCLAVTMRPLVFVHGLGDTFRGWSMPAQMAHRTFHILKTFSAEPGGAVFSMTKPFGHMVEDFAREVRAIPSLKNGFNLLGVSQGGLIGRAYIEKFNDPPVYNFISLHGPQSGIAGCPGSGLDSLPCNYAVHLGMVTPHDYWHGPDAEGNLSKEAYDSWGNYLHDINNEGEVKNQTYKENMISLNRYVMVKAERDQVVKPADSEWHGYYEWGGDMTRITKMEDTDIYQEDLIGLKTLDQANRIRRIKTSGGHLQLPPNFFEENVYPYLDNGWYQDGTQFDLGGTFEAVTHATTK